MKVTMTRFEDRQGLAAGGTTCGDGFTIAWQHTPRRMHNHYGALVEDVIEAAKERLEFYQDTKFNNPLNAEAIDHLEAALFVLGGKKLGRMDRIPRFYEK